MIVLGGGNTAVDAVRLAVRLGAARVTLVYRRGPDEMPAYDHEIDEARAEGVEFRYWLAPEAILGGREVAAVHCRRTAPGDPGPDGRRSVLTTDELIDLACDAVVVATGQAPRRGFMDDVAHLNVDAGGRIVVDAGFRTSHPRIWAGGDCVNGGKEVVNAVAEGMAAARDIDATLDGRR